MEISHVKMLTKDPKAILSFYQQRVKEALDHKPNRGHEILTEWEEKGIVSAIVTQNIDGYHQRAGSGNVIELHGNLGFHCPHCNSQLAPEGVLDMKQRDLLTCWICEKVGNEGMYRPNVVLFGEDLPQVPWRRALQVHAEADLCLVLGSSLAVYPANSLPEHTVGLGGKLVIVTKSETPLDRLSVAKIDSMTITQFLEVANGTLS
jgi:NAD-dependent deacetylase